GKMGGDDKVYFENGLVKSVAQYKNGVLNGSLMVYWSNKIVARQDNYKDGKLIDGVCFDSTGAKVPCTNYDVHTQSERISTIVQQMPVFRGDVSEYLSKNIKYPENEKKHGITGTVFINFIIEKDGSVSNVRVLKGIPNGPGLDAEAVRVISSMPKWIAGMQNGKLVRVSYNLPIRFVLN
ncbi:MAG TPA: TonB family protein, partial [Bacteroidia bacterium]|nr:TonB family protein [Bacteroidia bacterium]